MTIAQCTKLHQQAMGIAAQADIARKRRAFSKAKKFYNEALALERAAAMGFKDRLKYEPTRSVLFRSAATLANLAGDKRECERLLCMGLAGNPPDEIADELRQLWPNLQRIK